MKTKLFIISLLVMATGLLASCEGEHPTEKEMKNYLSVLSTYYPYSLDDEFIFENESLGQTWEAKAYDRYNEGLYPYTHISVCNDVGSKCRGDRSASIIAWMLGPEAYSYSEMSSGIYHEGGTNEVSIGWNVSLQMGDSACYKGSIQSVCRTEEVLSQLTDVITVPLHFEPLYPNMTIPSIDGAYARIVKGKGLTEFSLDGKTVWKRSVTSLD